MRRIKILVVEVHGKEAIDMKKFFAATLMLLMISAQVSAMQLSKEPIGKIFSDGNEYEIEGATVKEVDDTKGIARFGEDFYFHFDIIMELNSFGGRDVKNTAVLDNFRGSYEIYRVNNDGGADFFLVKLNTGTGDAIHVFGRRNGKWIEYLNVLHLRKKFDIGWNFTMSKILTEGNKIIFRYFLPGHFADLICSWDATTQDFSTKAIER